MLKKIDIELKHGPWFLKDLDKVEKHGGKVLSTFSCGGGSSYGYKLAGFDVLGCVEIDPKIYEIYKANHDIKYGFNMSIQEFNKISDDEMPKELFNLDVLDGSPPCSTFSTAGSREKKWGSAHHFREGQAKQNLDDLFFDFIKTVKRLQPKVVVAENVKGLIQGNARGYVKQIFAGFKDAGYSCQLFLLNAALMGVPQKRERVFFIANKLSKKISLNFNEKKILFRDIKDDCRISNLSKRELKIWNKRTSEDLHMGFVNKRLTGKITGFTSMIQKDNKVCYTITSSDNNVLYSCPRKYTEKEIISASTFPEDYNYCTTSVRYVCGMSVPPYMMQRIADQIYKQLLC